MRDPPVVSRFERFCDLPRIFERGLERLRRLESRSRDQMAVVIRVGESGQALLRGPLQ